MPLQESAVVEAIYKGLFGTSSEEGEHGRIGKNFFSGDIFIVAYLEKIRKEWEKGEGINTVILAKQHLFLMFSSR